MKNAGERGQIFRDNVGRLREVDQAAHQQNDDPTNQQTDDAFGEWSAEYLPPFRLYFCWSWCGLLFGLGQPLTECDLSMLYLHRWYRAGERVSDLDGGHWGRNSLHQAAKLHQ